jgi:tetratricopeptide (TPR) repeat protein
MGFRERPEYQDWRTGVFRLFGQKCIRCGYAGNIHAHHVMPVEDYPELAFEPTNGVPLCGNCHTEIKGNELAHADDLKRRQRAILEGEATHVTTDAPNESALRERAHADPSNAEAVLAWFQVADSRAVSDFYNQHPEDATRTAGHCGYVARCLKTKGQWQDVVAVCDKAIEITEREGTLEASVGDIAVAKWEAMGQLGRYPDTIPFLRQLVGRFPKVAVLHVCLSGLFQQIYNRAEKGSREAKDAIEESARHAVDAAQLAPGESSSASQACFLLCVKGDYPSALDYGKRGLALATSGEDKIGALRNIAWVYMSNDLYADARGYLREALQIDDCNATVIGEIAHCFFMEDNTREAIRMAKHGLMLDPRNRDCQQVVSSCEKLEGGPAPARAGPSGCFVLITGVALGLAAALGSVILLLAR